MLLNSRECRQHLNLNIVQVRYLILVFVNILIEHHPAHFPILYGVCYIYFPFIAIKSDSDNKI